MKEALKTIGKSKRIPMLSRNADPMKHLRIFCTSKKRLEYAWSIKTFTVSGSLLCRVGGGFYKTCLGRFVFCGKMNGDGYNR